LNNGPWVFDKPSPKWRRRPIMDGRFVCTVCFVSAYNGDPLQARTSRDGERLFCRQLHVTRSDEYDHDRFHS
jgi:nitrate reductase cytochrome c-type subunit